MQWRSAPILALSFLFCAVIGTAAQATSSPFPSVETVLSSLLTSNPVSPQITAPGTVTGFAGLTPANEGDIFVDVDPSASESGNSLLAAFVMLALFFGLMAVPIDPRATWIGAMPPSKSHPEGR